MSDQLLDEFEDAENKPITFGDVLKRWEKFRLNYLKIVGITGLSFMLLTLVFGGSSLNSFIVTGGSIYFLVGNICFCLGYAVELGNYVITKKYLPESTAKMFYRVGLWFSMILTIGLGSMAMLIVFEG
jgi:hypothetical protein